LRLVPALSVAENLMLGDLPVRRVLGMPVIDLKEMRAQALRALEPLDFTPDPDIRVDRLSFAERQLVAIAKALRKRCRLLILDEPTAALETREIERLFAVLARMKAQGTAIIYVSHRLDEVVTLADRCTVLRDGRVVAASRRGAFGVNDLVQAMTGRAEANIGAAALTRRRCSARRDEQRTDAIRLRAKELSASPAFSAAASTACCNGCSASTSTRGSIRIDGQPKRLAQPVDRDPRRHRHGAGRTAARTGDEPVGARQHPAAESSIA
jgi:ABC-type sugar transport system ATPase subunit